MVRVRETAYPRAQNTAFYEEKFAVYRTLHDALAGPSQLVLLPAAGHNDWLAQVDARWWQQRIDFLLGPPP